jgi:hypothetical protein
VSALCAMDSLVRDVWSTWSGCAWVLSAESSGVIFCVCCIAAQADQRYP